MDIHYPYIEPTTFTVILVENRLQQFVLRFDKHDHLNVFQKTTAKNLK